ncbi:hypothetical protein AQUCO_10800054v1 [Aquilegia coerulea]|uniref:Thioredoxin domain-containing protein n=1 Tax=Aquilegia coerulea TaxID=218851 RepID=A0A2G5C3F5_AQUCA|nr:hypothetical protein AQUCO_10800054v1 [Aquilegia coerulea]
MKMKMMMMMKMAQRGNNNYKPCFFTNKALQLLPSLYSSSIINPKKPSSSSSSSSNPSSSPISIISTNHHKTLSGSTSLFRSHFQQQHQIRCFSSSTSSSPSSNLAIVQSEQQLVNSLHKAQNDRLPSVFYFTAAWCGPCKLMSPVIQDLSKIYQNVNIYKIDIDLEELQSMLSNLKIHAVPTLHFFNNGEKAAEMVGADVVTLKKTMEDLYK